MKVLIVGSGGREHALAWKIARSQRLTRLFCAPGNGGTSVVAENVPLADSDIAGLAGFAAREAVDLTVVGPELPLSLGIVDEFERRGLRVFGPTRLAAELESSKIFSKRFMARHGIPTGQFRVAESAEEALAAVRSGEFEFPVVLKADGLAAGKGVIICRDLSAADEAIRMIMLERQFGAAGDRVLIEEFLRGREVSFIVITDGRRVLPLATAMDHKAVFDGDEGPNTGGMGAISPSPFVGPALHDEIMETIVRPTVERMADEGRPYRGALYAGLMLTEDGPKVLEYNGRFGDPETQPQLIRLESDLLEVLDAAARGEAPEQLEWSENPSACVILASGGYPGHYEKGKEIFGLDEAARRPGVVLFHAGTKKEGGRYLTNGGRVLGVCASEAALPATIKAAYEAIGSIRFEGMHFRRDIGTARM
jgi:phosphoribosylamine---glycine ligase